MQLDLTPRLKPENSIVTSLATVALVAAIYQTDVGTMAQVHMSPAYHGPAGSVIKKAGWTSLAVIGGLFILTRDPNVVVLGGAAVIAFHASYRHAHMADPDTGQVVPEGPAAYQPAQNVVALELQARA